MRSCSVSEVRQTLQHAQCELRKQRSTGNYVILHRRQAHHETRAEHLRTVRTVGNANAVLGPDASAMRLDDLTRNRKAKTGVLAEALMRAVGVEALEDPLHR